MNSASVSKTEQKGDTVQMAKFDMNFHSRQKASSIGLLKMNNKNGTNELIVSNEWHFSKSKFGYFAVKHCRRRDGDRDVWA